MKVKCICGHGKDVHAGRDRNDYSGECCVQYYKGDKLKCCPCEKFTLPKQGEQDGKD